MYVQVIDQNSPNKVKLFSRQHRFKVTKEAYQVLKHARAEGLLDFQVS